MERDAERGVDWVHLCPSRFRDTGLRLGGQPECGDSDIWEGALLDEAGDGLRSAIWSLPDSPTVNHRWYSSTNRAVPAPLVVVVGEVIQ